MKVHGYSRYEAQARIDAMRLLKTLPEMDEHIYSGALSLTVAAQTMSAFRKEDVRRKKNGESLLSAVEKKNVLNDLMKSSTREADRKLAAHFPRQFPPEKTKPLSATQTRIEFNASQRATTKFEQLKARLGRNQWDELFEKLADMALEHLNVPVGGDRTLKSVRSNKNYRSRYIPKQTCRQVWQNWRRGCEQILDNGERCGSARNLQIDHIQEFSEGGTHNLNNFKIIVRASQPHAVRPAA